VDEIFDLAQYAAGTGVKVQSVPMEILREAFLAEQLNSLSATSFA
jgi:hypothetical protein